MTPQEINQLNLWICLNVTSKLRRLSDEEYAETVKWSEEANEEPHPNTSLTQPYRYEGDFVDYTQPAPHAELIGKIVEKCGRIEIQNPKPNKFAAFAVMGKFATASTLPLAVMKLAMKIEWK